VVRRCLLSTTTAKKYVFKKDCHILPYCTADSRPMSFLLGLLNAIISTLSRNLSPCIGWCFLPCWILPCGEITHPQTSFWVHTFGSWIGFHQLWRPSSGVGRLGMKSCTEHVLYLWNDPIN
jgi:hypothetical protein